MVAAVIDDEDVFEWPGGEWCYRHELRDMEHLGDDYLIHRVGSAEWDVLHRNQYQHG